MLSKLVRPCGFNLYDMNVNKSFQESFYYKTLKSELIHDETIEAT
jgi:hypothetical protein